MLLLEHCMVFVLPVHPLLGVLQHFNSFSNFFKKSKKEETENKTNHNCFDNVL